MRDKKLQVGQYTSDYFFEFSFHHAAYRTHPVFGQLFKRCSEMDATLRISLMRVIYVATRRNALVF